MTSEEGDAWGCWGGSSGGAEVCSGSGSVPVARCVAGADGCASIRYMIDGVCHQAANRILRPCGATVTNARGYNVSFITYGQYGHGAWRWTDCCIACDAEHLLGGSGPSGGPPGLDESEARYVPQPNDRDEHIRSCVARFEQLIDAAPEPIERTLVERADQAVAAMTARQFDLLSSFEQRHLAADEFYRSFTDATREGYTRVDQALGRDRFLRLFGAPPEAVAELFDPEAFAKAQQAR